MPSSRHHDGGASGAFLFLYLVSLDEGGSAWLRKREADALLQVLLDLFDYARLLRVPSRDAKRMLFFHAPESASRRIPQWVTR